jgi:glutaredoxin
MKKTLQKLSLLMLAILFAGTALMYAGSQRTITTEIFTSASCGYCPQANDLVRNYVTDHPNNAMIPLTYRYNFGTDIMYNMNAAMFNQRAAYYAFSGVPHFFINGTTKIGGYTPQIPNIIDQEVQKHANEISPISIVIDEVKDGNNMNFTVSVTSDNALTNKTLRICAVEYHHFYENAGSNGEKDFYFLVRDMIPNANGQQITLEADETKEFEYSYEIKASMYNRDLMYVVAFVQDDATKEVLQAASSLKSSTPTIMTDVQFDKIDPNKVLSKEIVISNPTDETIEYDLTINTNNMASWVTGWTAEVTPTSVMVGPGQTKSALVNIRSSTTAGFFWVEVNATGKASNFINMPGKIVLYALSNNAKNVFFGWTSRSFALVYNDYMQMGAFQNSSALMPVDMIQYYDPAEFDLGIFTVDFWNGGVVGASSAATSAINTMIDAGKDVLITGERELYYSESQYGTPEAMKLFRGNLGISLGGRDLRVSVNSSNYITGILPFNLKGIDTDPISNQLNVQLNTWSSLQNDPYLVQTDYISLLPGSEAVPFIYADDNKSKIMGVRWEQGTTRVVFITFGFNGFVNQPQRSGFLSKVLVWLTQESIAGPKLSTNKTAVNFGNVDLDKTREMPFEIVNNGTTKTDLVIDELSIIGDGADGFVFVDLDNTISIPAGEAYTVDVLFSPTVDKEYNAVVTIKSENSVDQNEVTVSLVGKGVGESSVAELKDGTFSISALPNPFETVARIEYNAGYDFNSNVNMFVIDANGKIITTLVNSAVSAGTHSVEFNGSALASGTYYVIAQVNGETLRIPLILTK